MRSDADRHLHPVRRQRQVADAHTNGIGDRVGKGDAILLLFNVDVARAVALERRADVHGVGVELVARLDKGNRRVFERRIGTLGEGMVDTLAEGLTIKAC